MINYEKDTLQSTNFLMYSATAVNYHSECSHTTVRL